jgi:hypothetical protein
VFVRKRAWVLTAVTATTATTPAATPAHAAPSIDLQLTAEYRLETNWIAPLEDAGTAVGNTLWTEQRLRTDLTLAHDPVALHLEADLLPGVLFGDNGVYGHDPSPNSGVALATKLPNLTTWAIGLAPGADPLDEESYVPVLKATDAVKITRAYADVTLPVGLLRVGRQPVVYGALLSAHEGTRINRWGESKFADSVDRILFATKLDVAWRRLVEHDGPRKSDTSQDRGIFFGVFYDWLAQGLITNDDDETRQAGGAIQWRAPGRFLSVTLAHASDPRYATDVWAMPMKLDVQTPHLGVTLQAMPILGSSKEISSGFAALKNDPPVNQHIRALGAQAIIDAIFGAATFTFECDYASGDDDPRPTTDLTQFSFARDLNVGLLLFEQVMAFESARSAAVGIQNLATQNAASFPLTEVSTEGRFTNAIALFPQALVRFGHGLHLRTGVLFAWPAAPGGVVDPVETTLRYDGKQISDDAVNFAGGKPGHYYGTEFDGQLEWTWKERFIVTLEGAALLPGSSLENQYGRAIPSFLVTTRMVYAF